MAKVDILNYISESNILRSTYDTDTNELDITDVPQNLNSVITLGQSVSSGLNIGDSLILCVGSSNFFNDKLWIDQSNGALKRLSVNVSKNDVACRNFFQAAPQDHGENNFVSPIPVAAGKSEVNVLTKQSMQIGINEYTVVNNVVTAMPASSGWLNITADTLLTYAFSGTPDYIGINFRRDSNNTAFDIDTALYQVEVSFS